VAVDTLATVKRWAESLGYDSARIGWLLVAAQKEPKKVMRQLEQELAKAKRRGFPMTK